MQMLQMVVNVRGRKIVFAMVMSPGPRIRDAVFGVSGGVVGPESWDGGARLRVRGPARELGR